MDHTLQTTGQETAAGEKIARIPPTGDNTHATPRTMADSINTETFRSLMRNRSFMVLWIGQITSYIGDQFTTVAAIAVISQMVRLEQLATGDVGFSSAMPVALLAIAITLPQILFGLVAGVFVDRLDRKWVMFSTDVIRGLLILMTLFVHTPDDFWIFYLVGFGVYTAGIFFYPARSAVMPNIMSTERLAAANALLEAGFVIALIFGSSIAGVLVDHSGPFGTNGPYVAFTFDAATYFFSALMILIMRVPKRKAPETPPATFREVWNDLVTGLRYTWKTVELRSIMALSVVTAFSLGMVIILSLEYLENTLHIGPSGFGLVIAMLGIGVVVGGIFIQRLSRYLPTDRLTALALTINGLAVMGFVLKPRFGIVLSFAWLIGISLVVARTVLSTLTQAIPPDDLRGRVQSAYNLITQIATTSAIGIGGVAAQYLSSRSVFLTAGLITLASAAASLVALRGVDETVYGKGGGTT